MICTNIVTFSTARMLAELSDNCWCTITVPIVLLLYINWELMPANLTIMICTVCVRITCFRRDLFAHSFKDISRSSSIAYFSIHSRYNFVCDKLTLSFAQCFYPSVLPARLATVLCKLCVSSSYQSMHVQLSSVLAFTSCNRFQNGFD